MSTALNALPGKFKMSKLYCKHLWGTRISNVSPYAIWLNYPSYYMRHCKFWCTSNIHTTAMLVVCCCWNAYGHKISGRPSLFRAGTVFWTENVCDKLKNKQKLLVNFFESTEKKPKKLGNKSNSRKKIKVRKKNITFVFVIFSYIANSDTLIPLSLRYFLPNHSFLSGRNSWFFSPFMSCCLYHPLFSVIPLE